MSDDLVKRGRDHAELLRKMDEVCEPRWVSTPSQKLLKDMADEIERLHGMTECTMGVGKGDGQLFVHGDYDSIKAAQDIALRAEAAAIRARGQQDPA